MIKVLDIHVHDRGGPEAYKETPQHALEVARDSGVSGIFVMPNTKPALFTEELVRERLVHAASIGIKDVFYGIYMGLTKDSEQIKKAIGAYQKLHPKVVGFKLYAGHSVNELGVIDVEDQFKIFETLSREGFNGVLAVHCEKENLMRNETFNPEVPITHALARPEIAEIESVRDVITFAFLSGYKGKLDIKHISSPRAVEDVALAKQRGLNITCWVCPHHIIYDWTRMEKDDGLLYKMNPPLRKPGSPEKMLEYLKKGFISGIETDHAPHTLEDKTKSCCSGVPGLAHWPLFIEYLRGQNFSDQEIEKITYENAVKRHKVETPNNKNPIKDRRKEYAFDPYQSLDKSLNWSA